MIKISFEAPTSDALITLISHYLADYTMAPPAEAPAPAQPTGKPAPAPKVEKPAPAPAAAPAAEKPAAEAAAPAVVTYDQIAAAVPKTAGLGPNAAAKVKAQMVKWGVVPPKKVKDAVPADQYGAFLTELLAITND